jgi:hypothetical protein
MEGQPLTGPTSERLDGRPINAGIQERNPAHQIDLFAAVFL